MSVSLPPPAVDAELCAALRQHGHVFVPAATMRARLGALPGWDAFAASWARMPLDTYMADGGRYRRRRHAVFAAGDDGSLQRLPPQPHWQSRDDNPLNGGIARWFEALEPAVAGSASLQALLRFGTAQFGALAPAVREWTIEVHPFRIEAQADQPGRPTPEGVHRDGVDYVMVLMVRRHNIASGTTTIHSPEGAALGSFTLTLPFDAVLLDDRRVFHGVTPVLPLDAAQPAYRDVLVLTWRARRA